MMINILLVSPRLPPDDPHYCGDHAYTDTLLKFPPPGVTYYHYQDLIASGKIKRTRFWQNLSYYLTRWDILPPDMWVEALDSSFVPDILHIYGFSARVHFPRFVKNPLLVLGASTGSYSDLRDYHSWPAARIRQARKLKQCYLQVMDAHDSSLRPEKAAQVLVWSDFARQMHLEEGYVHPEQIKVIPPGMPNIEVKPRQQHKKKLITFLFVGRDFERKNGPLVLEAFQHIHMKYPHTRLLLIGKPKDGRALTAAGVVHWQFIARDKLLSEIYPQADVLLLPSKAEGFGLVILEAMSLGLPAIAVNAWAMPEIVQDGKNGFLIQPDSLEDLVSAMQSLIIDPTLLRTMQSNSKTIFSTRFSIDAHNQQLKTVYDQVLASLKKGRKSRGER